MFKVNVLIAKRGRNDQLDICLYYLNEANKEDRYDVCVYIIDDGAESHTELRKLPHLDVKYWIRQNLTQHFNKSKLLNYGLEICRSDFDWVSIVDIDMVYSPMFFDTVCAALHFCNYLISTGWKLEAEPTRKVYETKPPFDEILHYEPKTLFTVGPSQITLPKETLELFTKIFKSKFYNEDYEGWGAEDSEISFKARYMAQRGLLKRDTLHRMWIHLHHVLIYDLQAYEKNHNTFQNRIQENEVMIERYIHEHMLSSRV